MSKNKVGVNVDEGLKKLADMTLAVLSSNATIHDDIVNDKNKNIYASMPQTYSISDLLLLERQFGNVIMDTTKTDEYKYQAGDNYFSQIINIASKLIRVSAQDVIQNLQTFLSFIKLYFPPKFQDTWSNYISEIVRIASQNRTTNINELVDDGNFFNNMMLKIKQNPNYNQQLSEIRELVGDIKEKVSDPEIRNALLRRTEQEWSPIEMANNSVSYVDPNDVFNNNSSRHISFDNMSHSDLFGSIVSYKPNDSGLRSALGDRKQTNNNSTLLHSALGDSKPIDNSDALLRSAMGPDASPLKPEKLEADNSKDKNMRSLHSSIITKADCVNTNNAILAKAKTDPVFSTYVFGIDNMPPNTVLIEPNFLTEAQISNRSISIFTKSQAETKFREAGHDPDNGVKLKAFREDVINTAFSENFGDRNRELFKKYGVLVRPVIQNKDIYDAIRAFKMNNDNVEGSGFGGARKAKTESAKEIYRNNVTKTGYATEAQKLTNVHQINMIRNIERSTLSNNNKQDLERMPKIQRVFHDWIGYPRTEAERSFERRNRQVDATIDRLNTDPTERVTYDKRKELSTTENNSLSRHRQNVQTIGPQQESPARQIFNAMIGTITPWIRRENVQFNQGVAQQPMDAVEANINNVSPIRNAQNRSGTVPQQVEPEVSPENRGRNGRVCDF